jgi:hypothetical protein
MDGRTIAAATMKMVALAALAIVAAIQSASRAFAEASPSSGNNRPFIVFDATLYKGKPNLMAFGLQPIIAGNNFWRPGHSTDNVDDEGVRQEFGHYRNSNGLYYIDIEKWPILFASPAERAASINKLDRVLTLARSTAPKLRIGFYGVLPGTAYWPLVMRDARLQQWRDEDSTDLMPLAQKVDAVFPSLYTYYDDIEGWKTYARMTLEETRRFKKPVYAFLWPQFHDSNEKIRGQYLPVGFWRAELELCYQMADGIVIWGGWTATWDEHADWWLETKAFMTAHGIAVSPAT